ncbi:hypothetical protein L5176_002206 [Vibrio parahaemolyticus]|nr:hypothetical protein [Vibrio parahaemolyticus]
MTKEVKCYDLMVKGKIAESHSRKVVIEKILRDLDCNSFSSFTKLTEKIAEIYTKQEGTPLSGSTIRRKGSPYKSLVESYYNTPERFKNEQFSVEAKLQEKLLITELELSKANTQLDSTRKALQNAHAKMDQLRFDDIEARTDQAGAKEYSDNEVAAYNALVQLVQACNAAGVELDDFQISQLSLTGQKKTIINQEKLPAFFKWYREHRRG